MLSILPQIASIALSRAHQKLASGCPNTNRPGGPAEGRIHNVRPAIRNDKKASPIVVLLPELHGGIQGSRSGIPANTRA